MRGRARGSLVFLRIIKVGFIAGGQYGEGALRGAGRRGYYSIASALFGLQIGAQTFSQVLFLMADYAFAYHDRSAGFEFGVDLAASVIEVGGGGEVTSTTLPKPVIGIGFGESGLTGGLSLKARRSARSNADASGPARSDRHALRST